MTTIDRKKKLDALEHWADTVDPDDLVEVDTTSLKTLMALADQRSAVEAELVEAVRRARADHHTWSEIGTMLGVTKQAAQRKYARLIAA